MSREGTGSTSDLIAAIRWSADQGADVINMSVGGFPYSQIMQDAVNYAFAKGAVLVGAAGNNRREERFYPASFDNVISVSATQVNDEFSNWSSYGPDVDVSAPGSSVLTTNCYKCTYADHDSWGSHTYISGTSFATPNVSGVVALIRARYPALTPQQVVNRLFNTVDDLGYPGWDNRYGRGRVNAYRALGGSVGHPSLSSGDGAGAQQRARCGREGAARLDDAALDLPGRRRRRVRGRRAAGGAPGGPGQRGRGFARLPVEQERPSGGSDRRAVHELGHPDQAGGQPMGVRDRARGGLGRRLDARILVRILN